MPDPVSIAFAYGTLKMVQALRDRREATADVDRRIGGDTVTAERRQAAINAAVRKRREAREG